MASAHQSLTPIVSDTQHHRQRKSRDRWASTYSVAAYSEGGVCAHALGGSAATGSVVKGLVLSVALIEPGRGGVDPFFVGSMLGAGWRATPK